MLRTEWYVAGLALVVLACDSPKRPAGGANAGPQVRATVVTIRTALQPSNEISVHTIVIGPETARSTDEIQRWRLFDHKQNRVLFVDDETRSYRAEPLQALLARRRETRDVEVVRTPERRPIVGIAATKTILRRGAYVREVWIGEHPLIPAQLFTMIEASAAHPSALMSVRGFPLADHSELPYGDHAKLVVDRAVVSVVTRDVPESLFAIPRGYREVTAPAVGRRPASSAPRGQTTPAAESRPSSTTRTAP